MNQIAAFTTDGVVASLLYALVGAALLAVGVVVVDLVTPGKLIELLRAGSPNAAALIVANTIAVAAIVFAAGVTADDGTWEGLGTMAGYGALGIAAQAVLIGLIDRAFKVDFDTVLPSMRFEPVIAVFSALSVALGMVMVVAVV